MFAPGVTRTAVLAARDALYAVLQQFRREADADLAAPVPLHRLRLLRRRFNQSAMLARAICQGAAGDGPTLPPALLPVPALLHVG